MAYSKTFLLLGLLFAVVLIMSSEVSARELAETAQTQGSVQTDNAKHDGHEHEHKHEHEHEHKHEHEHEHKHGKGHHDKPGHGGHPGEKLEVETEAGGN